MSRVKSLICIIVSIVLLASMPAFSADASPEASASSAALYSPESGAVIYGKNADEQVPVAFLAKVVTALIVIEKLELSQVVAVTAEYNRGIIGLSAMNYLIGENIPVKDLLCAMFVQGADEAANILACAAAGSIDDFIPLMNQKASDLGAKDTYFTNTHGVNDTLSHTTAADAAKLLAAFAGYDALMEIADCTYYRSQATDMFPAREMYSSNSLLIESSAGYNPLCRGIKNDYDEAFGYSLGTYASSNGMNIVGVIFGAPRGEGDAALSYVEMNGLLEWAFAKFKLVGILEKDMPCGEIALALCKKTDKMVVTAADSFFYVLPADYDESLLTVENETPEKINAPVEQGQLLGEAVISYDGLEIGRVPVTAATAAELDNIMYYTWRITSFFGSPAVMIFSIVSLLLLVLYVIYVINFNKRRKKSYRSVNTKKYRR